MTDLTKVERMDIDNTDIMLNDVQKMQEMSRKLMASKHYQKMGEDGIFAICMAAKSNGISVTDALNGELYYVQGRVGMGYEAMNKYIRLAGHSVVVKHLDDKTCTLIGKRKDTGDTAVITYDMNDAKRAGKSYDKHPKAMLFARCLSMLKRFLFPDVLTKIYEKGELEDIKEDHNTHDNQTIEANVKQLYTENKMISNDQVNELEKLLDECNPKVKQNFFGFIKEKFDIDTVYNFPASEFEKHKNALTTRRDEYQKELAMAEMNNNREDGLVEVQEAE